MEPLGETYLEAYTNNIVIYTRDEQYENNNVKVMKNEKIERAKMERERE